MSKNQRHVLSKLCCNNTIVLVGVGGTGSQILSGLARLHLSMLALGNTTGLNVEAWDPDTVSEANVGRQLFYKGDIGRNKAEVLVNRINLAYGLDWDFSADSFSAKNNYHHGDILISCVDSRQSRNKIQKEILHLHMQSVFSYVIDCGNGPDYGQVIMGCPDDERMPMPWRDRPELYDITIPEDNAPSCSLAGALREQELFINQQVATCALQLLWELFRHGGLDKRGYVINQKSGKVLPLPLKKIEAEEAK